MENLAGKTILVTGATGRQGGAAARHLVSRGFAVAALTRHPDHAEAHLLARKGVRIVEGDLDDGPGLRKALEGVHGVFSVQNVIEHGFEGEIREGRNLFDAASAAGVKHVVHSSIASVDRDAGPPLAPGKAAVEEYLRGSGLAWTILRPVTFMENFDLSREEILQGRLRVPLPPDRKLQMIAVDDVGAFACMAFENPEAWKGKAIEIAGAEMTMPQVAQIFSEAIGREVVYEEVDMPALARANPGLVPMYTWLAEHGFEVDIPALRAEYPWLKTFGEWVRRARLDEISPQDSAMHRPLRHDESPVSQ
jgi:uncharacterized protein YbjT (DUF2867 family)